VRTTDRIRVIQRRPHRSLKEKFVPNHDIIVVGASAGGVEALLTLVRRLPPTLPAAVFVVLHIPAQSPSMLPQILGRAGTLIAEHGVDNAPIKHGHVYIAPPDHHLLLESDRMRVVRGPKENRHRPAVDPLFRTAARAYGPRVIGVVMTGALDDGTAGLRAIKMRGGIAVVQNPQEALYAGMPQSAVQHVDVDYVMPLAEIGSLLARLVTEPAADEHEFPVPPEMELEARVVGMDQSVAHQGEKVGPPSDFSCPECGGVLHELHDGDMLRFRCRVGHAFSSESVLAEQAEALEVALWTALNTLEESASLSRRLMADAQHNNREWLAKRFSEKVAEAEQRADVIRQVLLRNEIRPEGDGYAKPPSDFESTGYGQQPLQS
jgi:two-component system, chemotaxis family, protein-glutamate methylesterase/glutaminase